MAETLQQLHKKLMFDSPIPGESLTVSPDKKFPWDTPPRFVKVEDAVTSIFNSLSEPDSLSQVIDLMRTGVAIDDLAEVLTTAGFMEGKWSAHVKLLLLEPVMYMLYFFATQAGVDPIIYNEEDEDLDPGEQQEQLIKAAIGKKKNMVAPIGARRGKRNG